MALKKSLTLLLCALTLLGARGVVAATEVAVEGLMPGMAVVSINGQRKMLKAGKSFEGVTVVAVDAQKATLDVDGKRVVLGLSQKIGTQYEAPTEQVVTIARNAQLQYLTTATINGRMVQVLVDTGANIVAMNSRQAMALGIDPLDGEPSQVRTASGVVESFTLTLDSVDVGGITVNNVLASVVYGDYPQSILLGMTYLRHVTLQEQNGIMSLSRTP